MKWPVRLSDEDASFSRWKGGFDSHTGYWSRSRNGDRTPKRQESCPRFGTGSENGQVVELADTRSSEGRAS